MQRQTELEVSKFPYGRIGITISAVILILCTIYFYVEWPEIKAMKPNEFGDLLAGILGPLALLWLVLGFFQQGEELRHSVRALELQSEELRNSVEQQAALVEVTKFLRVKLSAHSRLKIAHSQNICANPFGLR